MTITLHHGDCLEVLAGMPANSIDSIITDPPYGLGKEPDALEMLRDWLDTGHHTPKSKAGFMGKSWDAFVPQPVVWRECLRVLKPGGHLLAFAGTRTQDLMALGLRIAGFEIRDLVAWVYGQGFPKSLNVSKAVDSQITMGGSSQIQMRQRDMGDEYRRHKNAGTEGFGDGNLRKGADGDRDLNAAAALQTDAARMWEGWGTALKPALEPITLARKPLRGTVAANVLQHGTGALNIDGCRVEHDAESAEWVERYGGKAGYQQGAVRFGTIGTTTGGSPLGRWPANLIHDGSDEVLAAFPDAPGQKAEASDDAPSEKTAGIFGPMRRAGEPSGDSENLGAVGFKMKPGARRLDTGSAARFFWSPKASSAERHEGLEHPGHQFVMGRMPHDAEQVNAKRRGNHHPTVKPVDLMRYLCRLITPPGGVVLDPYMGSGSTMKAAELEGFHGIGIEVDPEYVEIARRRIAADAPLFADVRVES